MYGYVAIAGLSLDVQRAKFCVVVPLMKLVMRRMSVLVTERDSEGFGELFWPFRILTQAGRAYVGCHTLLRSDKTCLVFVLTPWWYDVQRFIIMEYMWTVAVHFYRGAK